MEKTERLFIVLGPPLKEYVCFRSSFFGAHFASCNGSAFLISSLLCKQTNSSL